MLKNPTPRQIALLSSTWILGGSGLVFLVFFLVNGAFNSLLNYALLALGVFMVSYFVILSYLKKYILGSTWIAKSANEPKLSRCEEK